MRRLAIRIRSFLFRSKLFGKVYTSLSFSKAYIGDLLLSIRNAMPFSLASGGYKYRVLMVAHFLEKGMCYREKRPFGLWYVQELMNMLELFSDKEQSEFEYSMGISALRSWVSIFYEHGWKEEPLLATVEEFLFDKTKFEVAFGCRKIIQGEDTKEENEHKRKSDNLCILQRHSVREFRDMEIADGDIQHALRCFQATPTACNRQMCKVYYVKNEAHKSKLHQEIPGIGGLNKDTLAYFLITYDIRSLYGSLERNQGFFNAGLSAMNFVTGLTCKGLGTCFLQWDKRHKDEERVLRELGIPVHERIAVVIAAGYKTDQYCVPISSRRPLQDVYQIIN